MCGLAAVIDLRGEPVPDLEHRLAVMSELTRAPRARRRADLDPRARARRPRPPPPEHHRPRRRPPADGRRCRPLARLQRRDLQLPRAARASSAGRFRTASDTEVHPARPTSAGARLRSTGCAGCSRSRSGTSRAASCSARATASASSRSTTRSSATCSTSPPRPRRCCRSCRRSRPTSKGSRTTSRSSSASAARRSSRAFASCRPAHYLRLSRGGASPTRYWDVHYDLDFDHTADYFEERVESLLAESVELHLRSDVPVAASLSGGLDSSVVASLAARHSDARPGRVQRRALRRIPPTTRASTRASSPAGAASSSSRSRSTSTDFIGSIEDVVYGLDYPTAGPRLVRRSTSSQGPPASASRWSLADSGRRRGLRRLCALSDRLLRAVHQGGDRRHVTERQLRRHLRVDHPQPRLVAGVQAAAVELLEGGAVRRAGCALLPSDQPGAAARARGRHRRARRLLAVRDLPRDFPRPQRRPRVLLRQDDPLRLQDAAACAAAGRGSRKHGPRPRVACADPRPSPGRACRDDPGGREVQGRRAQARVQARDAVAAARRGWPSAGTRWGSRSRWRTG